MKTEKMDEDWGVETELKDNGSSGGYKTLIEQKLPQEVFSFHPFISCYHFYYYFTILCY